MFMKIKTLFTSFFNAFQGVKYVFVREQNFRLQIFISVIVLLLAFVFQLRIHEIIVILLLIFLVLILELLNSAVEVFVDVVKPRLSQQIKVVKDIMAGMVFLSAVGSAIIGIIIFWPYVVKLF